ncbi:MAG TPA: EAL domain-containing protein [Acidimicrobiales bacterium]|nr:EAL domain-containing protein [Acidimicrobiales bacterium]
MVACVAAIEALIRLRAARSEERQLHRQLDASEAFNRSLVEATDEAILSVCADGTIGSANRAAARLLGLPAARMVGMPATALAGRLPLLADVPVGITDADAVAHPAEGATRSILVTTRRTRDEPPVVAVFARDISERKQLEDRLAHQATHDSLTGLANRASLVAELDRAAARAEWSGEGFGLLFIDLDRFKAINDTLGHRVGDVVLQRVAQRLVHATRDTDLVARNGGDEFVVLAEEAHDVTVVARLAERIQDALSEAVRIDDDAIPVSASIGVAWLEPGDEHTLDQLRDADVAMYHAKSSGPGQIRVFDDDMRLAVEQRFDLERELRRAVGAGALDACIQPVIDLRTGRVTGGELLCRWTTQDGREVPPEAFIEVAEDSTLVVEIGRWMLERAGGLLHDWSLDTTGLADLRLSVNLSGRHIDHPGVVEDVTGLWAHGGIDPSKLIIEITETSLLRDLDEAARTLDELRRAGVTICVDDFGVGYASFRYLRELPVELVKIDRSIVSGFGRNDSDTVIVTMLSRLADVLEIEIVAEGLETEDQREQLAELGCHYAQGYLFARAMPIEVFPAWLARWRRHHTHPSAWRTVAGTP